MSSFSTFELLPTLQSTLTEKNFKTPTEIQNKALPLLLSGKSVVGLAETGSGKTLAFVLPILQLVKTLESDGTAVDKPGRPRAAVIVPTRELGEQISKVLKVFTHTTRVRVRTVFGGVAMDVAKQNVRAPFEILVATPGRLIQLMDTKQIELSDVRLLVFDEADQMLDSGFLSDATRIAEACAPDRQMALFTATLSGMTQDLINKLFSQAESVRSGGSHRVVPSLTTKNVQVIDGKRFPLLEKILAKPNDGGTLIFTNTREQCDNLSELLTKSGKKCVVYRGEMDKIVRKNNLKSFREGTDKILISTDLASRGLDVEHVSLVINYHLPREIENYLHRAGRTARAGRTGTVINLVTERDGSLMSKLGDIKY